MNIGKRLFTALAVVLAAGVVVTASGAYGGPALTNTQHAVTHAAQQSNGVIDFY